MHTIHLRELGLLDYQDALARMQAFTAARGPDTADEWWLTEHPPVFTLGLAGRHEHLLAPGDIPVVQSDRGGQVTYHGPGQMLCYVLMDPRRLQLGVRALVGALEQGVLDLLATHGVGGQRREGAPGVYVAGRKLASVGLRMRRSGTYHGIAINVDMDLAPFGRINPCGYAGLEMTQLAELVRPAPQLDVVGQGYVRMLAELLDLDLVPAPV